MRMMTIVATPDRNIAIAPPDRMEWRPTSSFVNPKTCAPINSTIARNLGRACDEFIHETFPSDEMNEHSFVSFVAPGMRKTLFTVKAAANTGHSRPSSVRNICTE